MKLTLVACLAMITPALAAAHAVGDPCSKAEAGNAVCTVGKEFLKCTRKDGWKWNAGFACNERESCVNLKDRKDIVACPKEPTTSGSTTKPVKFDRGPFVEEKLKEISASNKVNGKAANVLIFNMQQQFQWLDPSKPSSELPKEKAPVKTGEFKINNVQYHYWVFETAAIFKNLGDGGWVNWGFSGFYERQTDERIVKFSARLNK